MSEQWLLQQVITGETEAFDRLMTPYKPYLQKVIYSFTKNDQDTEEAYQEISQKVFAAANTFHGASFKSWITRVAINYCIDQQRRSRAEQISLEDAEASPQYAEQLSAQAGKSLKEQMIDQEEDETLMQIISELPSIYRDAIRLHYFSEYSYAEIAAQMDTNIRTIESRIFRARKMIEERMKKYAL